MSLFYHASFSFEGELDALDYTMFQGSFPKFKIQFISGKTHVELWSETMITLQLIFYSASWRTNHFNELTWEQFSQTYVGKA